jgi:hypothetical protein
MSPQGELNEGAGSIGILLLARMMLVDFKCNKKERL